MSHIKMRITTRCTWLPYNCVFYFELSYRKKINKYLLTDFNQICQLAEESKLLFIYPKFIAENNVSFEALITKYIGSMPLSKKDEILRWETLKEVFMSLKKEEIYDQIEWDIFNYQAIEPAYFLRRLNETELILWPYTLFVNKVGNNAQIPKESILPQKEFSKLYSNLEGL